MPNLVSLIFYFLLIQQFSAFFKIINQYTFETQKKRREGIEPESSNEWRHSLYLIDCGKFTYELWAHKTKIPTKQLKKTSPRENQVSDN
jgi:hypothetical protein